MVVIGLLRAKFSGMPPITDLASAIHVLNALKTPSLRKRLQDIKVIHGVDLIGELTNAISMYQQTVGSTLSGQPTQTVGSQPTQPTQPTSNGCMVKEAYQKQGLPAMPQYHVEPSTVGKICPVGYIWDLVDQKCKRKVMIV